MATLETKLGPLVETLSMQSRNGDQLSQICMLVEQSAQPERNAQLLENVLAAEANCSFFDVDHYATTVGQIEAFDYETASLFCEVFQILYGLDKFLIEQTLFDGGDTSFISHALLTYAKKAGSNYLLVFLSQCVITLIQALKQINFYETASYKTVRGYRPAKSSSVKSNTVMVKNQQDISAIPVVQQLVRDPVLLKIIQGYLDCPPIHVQVNCWWTVNYSTEQTALSGSAQLFHQDKEFIKFVKIFIYLRDVTAENGPHTYIEGSHRHNQHVFDESYTTSARLTDEYLAIKYDQDKFIKMLGPKGTIILEDTNGFHKGSPVLEVLNLVNSSPPP